MGIVTVHGALQRPADAMSPERDLILCCARARIDPEMKGRIRALIGNGLNWPEVVLHANQHRVMPILHEGIASAAPDLISPAVQRILRDSAYASSANGMKLLLELLRIHQLFEVAQIPAIPYKGPVLAHLAYGSFVRREFLDLDFAVPQRYIPQATALLQSAEYSALFDLREAHAGQHGFAPGQYSFLSSADSFLVELHTERTLRYFPVPPDFADLTLRLMEVEIAGRRVRTFSIEDTLVILSVHGAKHFWERLAWILDIAQLLAVREVDWTLLTQIAARMKSARVLLLGLFLAHDLCGASLPPSVLRNAMEDKQVQWLAARVREQYAGISDPGAGVGARTVFRVRSSDSIGQGLRHMLRLTMSPTESDREIVRLPDFLTPFYILVRPWRLLREYGLGVRTPIKAGPRDLSSKPTENRGSNAALPK
jgi:hypothetical protein